MENLTNKYIDLHIHTTYSDGTASLPEIIHEARIKQSKMIAITDHDRLLSKEDISLISKVKGNMMVIPGAELSTDYYLDGKKIRLHILCYGLDERATDLNDKLVQFEQAREERKPKSIYMNYVKDWISWTSKNLMHLIIKNMVGFPKEF